MRKNFEIVELNNKRYSLLINSLSGAGLSMHFLHAQYLEIEDIFLNLIFTDGNEKLNRDAINEMIVKDHIPSRYVLVSKIKLRDFKFLMSKVYDFHRRVSVINGLNCGISIANYCNNYFQNIELLFKVIYNYYQYEWIDYYLNLQDGDVIDQKHKDMQSVPQCRNLDELFGILLMEDIDED
jgi:hypothetical protein